MALVKKKLGKPCGKGKKWIIRKTKTGKWLFYCGKPKKR